MIEQTTGILEKDPKFSGLIVNDPEHTGLALDFALRDFIGHPVKVTEADGMGRKWILIECEKTDAEIRREVAW